RRHHGVRPVQFLQSLGRCERRGSDVAERSSSIRQAPRDTRVYIKQMIRVYSRSLAAIIILKTSAGAQPQRARDRGVSFDGTHATWNAITDIAGIEVGHATLIESPSVRTGVTAVWPRGKQSDDPAFGGWFSLNGNGEMTGTTWVEESGFVDGPILITNTHS